MVANKPYPSFSPALKKKIFFKKKDRLIAQGEKAVYVGCVFGGVWGNARGNWPRKEKHFHLINKHFYAVQAYLFAKTRTTVKSTIVAL